MLCRVPRGDRHVHVNCVIMLDVTYACLSFICPAYTATVQSYCTGYSKTRARPRPAALAPTETPHCNPRDTRETTDKRHVRVCARGSACGTTHSTTALAATRHLLALGRAARAKSAAIVEPSRRRCE